ncbi:uncharacterized protein LOC129740500 [Uranotaenia lowii]|uniref:uncharacterized protein LOC129740500 n=1 Tax=Uranotaenia lowii TaxID=190385 RepID=UPI002479B8B3|nr:uncharacterized protein LOC129740500 [Uranotaenia lowii]
MIFNTILNVTLLANVTLALQVMYEGFQQFSGFETIEYAVRIRKINRTTTAATGKIIFKKEIGADYKFTMRFFHSPLGNQQFIYYPMKIPESDVCFFFKFIYPDYVDYFKDYLTNLPKVGECPISPRVVEMNNHIMDSRMFPKYMPAGLWKAVLTGEGLGDNVTFELTANMRGDNYYGG